MHGSLKGVCNRAVKVIRSGPTINYAADPFVADGDPETFCGGEDGIYKVQKFATDFYIRKGSYIAIKAKKTGTLYCSGGSGTKLITPALKTGEQSLPDSSASCNLLVALYYMHLRYEKGRLRLLAAAPLPFTVILVVAVLQEHFK